MIVYFDHLISVFVAGVFIMILVAFQSIIRETSVGRTLLYTGKSQTLNLADMLERDSRMSDTKRLPAKTALNCTVRGLWRAWR